MYRNGTALGESNVVSYGKTFPDTFAKAVGSLVFGRNDRRYIDFLSACGALNYGHNHPILKAALLEYIADDGMTMSLDVSTQARSAFLQAFRRTLLEPRDMDHLIQFPGPTGTNAVEAAIKLARKVTGRSSVIAFTNGFHGCSLGALALTGSAHHRKAVSALLSQVARMPYDGYFGAQVETAGLIGQMLDDPSSGIDAPAAFIVEVVQGEGGLNACRAEWLRAIAALARRHGALLIIDDIQAGCGRAGSGFFSFDGMDVVPDLICLSKSLSGYGLPMSLLLLRPELDIWEAGEHNGTFRGNNLAFVTATAALETFWQDDAFKWQVDGKAELLAGRLDALAGEYGFVRKGRGLMQGLRFDAPEEAGEVQRLCFTNGLMLERCGPHDEVLKLLPALTIEEALLEEGLQIIAQAIAAVRAAGPASPVREVRA